MKNDDDGSDKKTSEKYKKAMLQYLSAKPKKLKKSGSQLPERDSLHDR